MIQETVEKTVDEKLQDVVEIISDDKFPNDEELFEDVTSIDDAENSSMDDIMDDFGEEIDDIISDEETSKEENEEEKESSVEEISDEDIKEEEECFSCVDDFLGENELSSNSEDNIFEDEEVVEQSTEENTEDEEDFPTVEIFDAVGKEDEDKGGLYDEEDQFVTVVENNGIQEIQVQPSMEEDVLKTAVERLNSNEPIVQDDTDILEKIEKILSNPESEKEHKAEIELFKKLRVLSKFLPESQKNDFYSCKMKLVIEYIISKMSGKPGLLLTTESLLKSGVLGKEYESQLFNSDPAPISDSLVVDVLLTMKELARGLEDKELYTSLIVNIDSLLEAIEIQEQKNKIF